MLGIYGKTLLTAGIIPDLAPVAMERMSFIKDRLHENIKVMGLEPITFSHREEMKTRGLALPDDYLFWALTSTMGGEDDQAHEQQLDSEASEKKALQVSEHWSPNLRTIIENQQRGETSAFNITCVQPDFQAWDANEHVTILGDAMHPMPPTGSGAVTALVDALVLCRVLAEEGQSLAAIEKYENEMRAVARVAVGNSWKMIKGLAGMTRSNEQHLGEMAMQIRARLMGNK